MISEEQYSAIVEYARKSAAGDAIGLWEIVSRVKSALAQSAPAEVKWETIRIIDRMLRNDGFIAGNIDSQTLQFKAWRQDAGESVERIDAAWQKLGRDPALWEIAWLALKQ